MHVVRVLSDILYIPMKLSLNRGGPPTVDYKLGDRKVNQISINYNLMLLDVGPPFTPYVDDFKGWAPLL